MNTNDDKSQIPEWATLGTELLEGSMADPFYEEALSLLNVPGVDPALYMLFCSLPQGQVCINNSYPTGTLSVAEVRGLMQCAFMLGSYVRKSIEEAEKLW